MRQHDDDDEPARGVRRERSLDLNDVFVGENLAKKKEVQSRSRSESPTGHVRRSKQRRPRKDGNNGSNNQAGSTEDSAAPDSPGELKSYLSQPPANPINPFAEDKDRDAEDEATIGSKQKAKRKEEREKKRKDQKKSSSGKDSSSKSRRSKSRREREGKTGRSVSPSKKMLREPSRRIIADESGEKEEGEESENSFEFTETERASSALSNFVVATKNDDDEHEGTVLQFDPTQAENVFAVKQVHNSGSECEMGTADGSQTISISECNDLMSSAQQHNQSASNQPIFDFLEDHAAEPPGQQQQQQREAQQKAKQRKSKDSDQAPKSPSKRGDRTLGKKMVGDADSYAQFFAADPTAPVSPRRTTEKMRTAPSHNASWPPASPDEKDKLQKRKVNKKKKPPEPPLADGESVAEETTTKRSSKSKKSSRKKSPSQRRKRSTSMDEIVLSPTRQSRSKSVDEIILSPGRRGKRPQPLPQPSQQIEDLHKSTPLSPDKLETLLQPSRSEGLDLLLQPSQSDNLDFLGSPRNRSNIEGIASTPELPPYTDRAAETNDDEENARKAETTSLRSQRSWDKEFDDRLDERQQQAGKMKRKNGGGGLTTSIGRYFGRVRGAPSGTGTDVDASDRDDGSVYSSNSAMSGSSRGSMFSRGRASRRRGHQLLSDDSAESSSANTR